MTERILENEPVDGVHMEFFFASGTLEVKTQYVVYNGMSFLADIGGFLGLLLGQSCYGIYVAMLFIFEKSKKSKKIG